MSTTFSSPGKRLEVRLGVEGDVFFGKVGGPDGGCGLAIALIAELRRGTNGYDFPLLVRARP